MVWIALLITLFYWPLAEAAPPGLRLLAEAGKPKLATRENDKLVFQVVEDFLDMVKHGKLPQAYFGYTSKDFRSHADPDQFKRLMIQFPSFSRNEKTTVQGLVYIENVATLTALMTSFDKQSNIVEFHIIYEDGAWKILGLQVFSAQEKPVKS